MNTLQKLTDWFVRSGTAEKFDKDAERERLTGRKRLADQLAAVRGRFDAEVQPLLQAETEARERLRLAEVAAKTAAEKVHAAIAGRQTAVFRIDSAREEIERALRETAPALLHQAVERLRNRHDQTLAVRQALAALTELELAACDNVEERIANIVKTLPTRTPDGIPVEAMA